jgi:hypothetical protein
MKISIPLRRSFLLTLLVVFLLVIAPLTSAKAIGSGTPADPYLTNSGCLVTVSFSSTMATSYKLELFDDLSLIYQNTLTSTGAGQTMIFNFVFPSVNKGIPGIGVYLYEGGTLVYSYDPYVAIENTCLPSCAEGAYQGVTTGWTKLYWGTADNKAVVPTTFIEPNKRVSVVDNPVPGWYKIALACQYYYIKVGTLQTNYEKSAKPFLNGR